MARGEARPSQAILTIDLGAIARNYRRMARELRGASCAGVVKADGYGLGAARVGPALWRAGCREFFVAHLREAIELRAALPRSATIYVLNGLLKGEESELRRHRIVPVLNDLRQAARWRREARRVETALPAVLHVDTGMSRLGLDEDEAAKLLASPTLLGGLDLRLIMSHLACADEPGHPLNDVQIARLRAFRGHFPGVRASLANSAGIMLDRATHFDMARPGCALYGIAPIPGRRSPVRAVARLEAPVIELRTIRSPATIGYGATCPARAGMRVATIALGYADGWLRALSNKGFACYRGTLLPFAGRVSMDLITLDATKVPRLRVGDRVELLGSTIDADAVAERAGTNGYEVLTRLGRRFARHYIDSTSA